MYFRYVNGIFLIVLISIFNIHWVIFDWPLGQFCYADMATLYNENKTENVIWLSVIIKSQTFSRLNSQNTLALLKERPPINTSKYFPNKFKLFTFLCYTESLTQNQVFRNNRPSLQKVQRHVRLSKISLIHLAVRKKETKMRENAKFSKKETHQKKGQLLSQEIQFLIW